MGHEQLRSGRPVSRRTGAKECFPLRHLAIFDLGPAAIDHALRAPVRKTLLGCERNQLIWPWVQGYKKHPVLHGEFVYMDVEPRR